MNQAMLGVEVLKQVLGEIEYDDLQELAKKVMSKALESGVLWYTSDNGVQLRAALATVYVLAKEEDKAVVERELAAIRRLGDLFSGTRSIDSFLEELGQDDDYDPIGLIGIWHDLITERDKLKVPLDVDFQEAEVQMFAQFKKKQG